MIPRIAIRQFSHHAPRLQAQAEKVATGAAVAAAAAKPRRKVGAFRGGFLGFLLGATLSGYGAYYYVFDEYRAANNVVLADVVQLQSSIRRLEDHVANLESQLKK